MKLVNRKPRKAIRKSVKKVVKKHGAKIAAGLAGGFASALAALASTDAPESHGKQTNLAQVFGKLTNVTKGSRKKARKRAAAHGAGEEKARSGKRGSLLAEAEDRPS